MLLSCSSLLVFQQNNARLCCMYISLICQTCILCIPCAWLFWHMSADCVCAVCRLLSIFRSRICSTCACLISSCISSRHESTHERTRENCCRSKYSAKNHAQHVTQRVCVTHMLKQSPCSSTHSIHYLTKQPPRQLIQSRPHFLLVRRCLERPVKYAYHWQTAIGSVPSAY